MTNPTSVRKEVSRAYAHAISSTMPAGGGCCSSTDPKGALAKAAGYTDELVKDLPAGAAESSFGCGNPLAFSEVRPGEVVLDLGCGAGLDVMLAAQRVGPNGRVIGVDMTDAMIARARDAVAAAGLQNVEIRKGIIEELPVESGTVDWVISNCVINLSPEKDRVFAEIARVLKPGGRVRVSDVLAENLPANVLEDYRAYASCVAGAISPEEYRAGLERAGLSEVKVHCNQELSAGQIEALIESDERACCGSGGNGCTPKAGASVAEVAAASTGRVWVAEISARKR